MIKKKEKIIKAWAIVSRWGNITFSRAYDRYNIFKGPRIADWQKWRKDNKIKKVEIKILK